MVNNIQARISKPQNLCPVCGYQMDDPPADCNICPSCGTEFGIHDANATIADLREAWIASGPKWWSVTEPQPDNWDPFTQLGTLALPSAPVKPAKGVTHIIATANSSQSVTTMLGGAWVQEAWGRSVNTQSASVLQ